MTLTTFDKLIKVASDSKNSLKIANLEAVDELFQYFTTECENNKDYFMKPRFLEVLDGVVELIKIGAGGQNNSRGMLKFCNTIFQLLDVLLKEESVRITLRDRHKLLFLVSPFFDPSLPPSGITLVLGVLEATSRNMSIEWKPPQLTALLKSLYTYISQNPEPSASLTLAFQLLLNLCQENPSCALIGQLDGTHKKIMEVLTGFWKGASKNKIVYLLGTHLMLHYEPMLPAEILHAGYFIMTTSTTQAVTNYQNSGKNGTVDAWAPTFLQLADFVTTITRKLAPFFAAGNALDLSLTDSDVDHKLNSKVVSDIKDTFIQASASILKKLKTLVPPNRRPVDSNCKFLEEMLQYLISLLPPFIPISQHMTAYKECLLITNALWETADKGSGIYHGCLAVYVHIMELVTSKQDEEGLFTKVTEGLFGHNVLSKLRLTTDLSPASVDLNILSIRLIACLTDSVFSEEVSKKLDLKLVRPLILGLVETDDILPSVKWRRMTCLLELMAVMSKYNRESDMLGQLISFMSTESVAKQISNGILHGDEREVRNAIAVTSVTSFEESVLSCIAKSIVKGKNSCWTTRDTRMIELSPAVSRGAFSLEQALNTFPQFLQKENGKRQPDLDDLLTWYNLKDELHKHELELANQNISQLQLTIDRLKTLMEKQVQMVCKQTLENNNKKSEMFTLQNTLVSRQKSYTAKISALEQEMNARKSECEAAKSKLTELATALEGMEAEKQQLLGRLKQEEETREETVEKFKALREASKTLKGDLARIKTQLAERDEKLAGLESSLKYKEDESLKHKILLENERRKLDTIRGVIGANFGNIPGVNLN